MLDRFGATCWTKRYPGPPGWGLGVGINSDLVNTLLYLKSGNGKAMPIV